MIAGGQFSIFIVGRHFYVFQFIKKAADKIRDFATAVFSAAGPSQSLDGSFPFVFR